MSLFEAIRVWWRTRHEPKSRVCSSWEVMVLAASEEWGDETVFKFAPPLSRESCQKLVRAIRDATMVPPVDLDSLKWELAKQSGLPLDETLTAIDRALGGFCRGAARYEGAIPDPAIDPIGAAACELAMQDDGLLDEMFGNWRNWRPGCHSSPDDRARFDEKRRLGT